MHDGDILILKGRDVASLLEGRETELLQIVKAAYETHSMGDSSVPHSLFLRFPDNPRNRIIALPAYLGADFGVAGIKWVSSFPANLEKGHDRASAVVILNSSETGRPQAILEGSIISAKRTAASAALAATYLQDDKTDCAGIIGCGLISFEIVRFLSVACPEIRTLYVFDIYPGNAQEFKDQCRGISDRIEVIIAGDVNTVISKCRLISLATTAAKPHITDISAAAPGSTILHISLRDLSPGIILSCNNIVDDIGHVCRAETSIHLTEQVVGNRDFIRGTLADVTTGAIAARDNPNETVVFSPFGLGILDLALSKFVLELGLQPGLGTTIESFLPDRWVERREKSAAS
jgi:N-[(2S)-2-amino-2-carboxyethyl]-L-glutamate dehydrogenase